MRLNIVEIRSHLAETINRVAYQGQRVILERRGKGVAAMVPLEDLELLEALEEREDLQAALRARKEEGSVTLEQMKDRLGMT